MNMVHGRWPRRREADALARGLGWFSIALGVAELVAPRGLGRAAGAAYRPSMVRACGLREIATGIGILRASDPKPWVWARVAGDVADLAALAPSLGKRPRARTGAAFAAVGLVTLIDYCTARQLAHDAARRPPARDYSARSGFPRPPSAMRGAAVQAWTGGR